MFNPNEPLGLPRGSVRAIITLAVVITACIGFGVNGALPDGLDSPLSIVLAFYFIKRTADDASNPAQPVEDKLPEPYVESARA